MISLHGHSDIRSTTAKLRELSTSADMTVTTVYFHEVLGAVGLKMMTRKVQDTIAGGPPGRAVRYYPRELEASSKEGYSAPNGSQPRNVDFRKL